MDNNDSFSKDTEEVREDTYHFGDSLNPKHSAGRNSIDIKGAAGENLEENEQHIIGNFQFLYSFFHV